MTHDGNIRNITFHKRLSKRAMMCTGLSTLGNLPWFSPTRLAFTFDFITFIDGHGKLEVEFVIVEIEEEFVEFGILFFLRSWRKKKIAAKTRRANTW